MVRGGRRRRRYNVPRAAGSRGADVEKCNLDLHCDKSVMFWISGFSDRSQRTVRIFSASNYLTKTDVYDPLWRFDSFS